jgi:hypothetical protein
MQFASAQSAYREVHWAAAVCFVIVAGLFVIALYLTVRATLTKSHKIPQAPLHIQEASEILKWIAITSPLLMLLGSFVDMNDQIVAVSYTGIEAGTPYILLWAFLFLVMIGILVSLFALCGIALIFVKLLRYQRRQSRQE